MWKTVKKDDSNYMVGRKQGNKAPVWSSSYSFKPMSPVTWHFLSKPLLLNILKPYDIGDQTVSWHFALSHNNMLYYYIYFVLFCMCMYMEVGKTACLLWHAHGSLEIMEIWLLRPPKPLHLTIFLLWKLSQSHLDFFFKLELWSILN